MRYFVDSNVFLNYYNGDDKEQSDAAARIFERASRGEIEIFCAPPVLFEVAWVLRARFGLSHSTILSVLESIVSMPFISVLDKEFVMSAIEISRATQQGFADSYIAVVAARNGAGVATFNRKHFCKFGLELYPIGGI